MRMCGWMTGDRACLDVLTGWFSCAAPVRNLVSMELLRSKLLILELGLTEMFVHPDRQCCMRNRNDARYTVITQSPLITATPSENSPRANPDCLKDRSCSGGVLCIDTLAEVSSEECRPCRVHELMVKCVRYRERNTPSVRPQSHLIYAGSSWLCGRLSLGILQTGHAAWGSRGVAKSRVLIR